MRRGKVIKPTERNGRERIRSELLRENESLAIREEEEEKIDEGRNHRPRLFLHPPPPSPQQDINEKREKSFASSFFSRLGQYHHSISLCLGLHQTLSPADGWKCIYSDVRQINDRLIPVPIPLQFII